MHLKYKAKSLTSQGVRNEKKVSPYRRRYNLALLMFNIAKDANASCYQGFNVSIMQKVGLILMIIFGFAMSNDKKLPIDVER
ncbi:hypothetical protein [Helicobacter pylori]|uniref:hypothetical protein n=1 Tax=Helicobacter pylori TaxID=210 RepID=UPI001FD0190F|nr:hypothetical protein [Helicobacter pylori]UOR82411.1 hypothetical protein MPF96_02845 [Helicobacter pylori]